LIAWGCVIADRFAAVPREPGGEMRELDGSGASQEVRIGDDVWIGARAVILGGATVGDGAIIGTGTVVERQVPDYAVLAGNPARIVGWERPGA
jgi:acetyltransferase-like isoleucine patch superfamily enzyme